MPLGLTFVRDAFQHKLDIIFNSLESWTGISSDYMIKWSEEADESDHDNT